ncbi:nucleotidyltransferase domain-containing protein [Enterocloster sp. OA13]|uniref:nucleotidyltransferase domain-containing protein n=1 Tax=Enterocloster sp. OA13 TaxID=2914161 RepID=UPI00046ED1D8|nr:nucleotidyltransferase domain-containing protein [Enterocloster sp. OA13]
MIGIIDEIQMKLKEIEKQEHVTILHAVESGSRAWGFASPDSDYDVRFIYVRAREDYLRLDEPRDVIEWQMDEVLDINGWDLKKTLKHFHRGNATLFEWGNSPVVYKTTDIWNRIHDAAAPCFSVKAAVHHYCGTAGNTCDQFLQENQVRYKKYFYALRPLLAGRYILEKGCPPPVLFDDLMKMEMPGDLRAGIEELLEIKKRSGESEKGQRIPVIQDFIEQELKRQKAAASVLADDRMNGWEELNHVFLEVLEMLD